MARSGTFFSTYQFCQNQLRLFFVAVLKQLKKSVDTQIKNGASSPWAKSNSQTFDTLLNKLLELGIVIVPNGSLESWAPEVEPKVRFAELAPDFIDNTPEQKRKFKKFADKLLGFLKIC